MRIELGPGKQPFRLQLPKILVLGAVIVLTIAGFQWHFERMAERYEAQALIRDETATLSTRQMDLLRQVGAALRDGYGLTLRVVVRHGTTEPPALDAKTIYIGLDTAANKGVVVLPPLLAKALPPELVESLAGPWFEPYFAAQDWPEGLMACLTYSGGFR